MSQQIGGAVHKGSPKEIGYLLIALFIEAIALYFGLNGIDFLFGECSYSLVPFLIVLLLATLGFVLAIVSIIKLFKTRHRGSMAFGVIVTILCAVIGCYGALAASFTFCF